MSGGLMSVTSESDRQTQTQTPYFRTYSRRALFDLPQTLHGGRARRARHKMCPSFFDPIHSFPLGGELLIVGYNTGRLPLRGSCR